MVMYCPSTTSLARDAVKQATVHRESPSQQNYPVQNVSNANEKSCSNQKGKNQ